MNQIKFVALNRAEGFIEECFSIVFSSTPLKEPIQDNHFKNPKINLSNNIKSDVLNQFSEWGKSAPEDGYDKVDFIVEWDNGKSYSGRFDMQQGGKDGGEDFWTSLQHRIQFYACERRPSHFKQEHWEHHCQRTEKEGWKGECQQILQNCQI